jgi:hypothetical protein
LALAALLALNNMDPVATMTSHQGGLTAWAARPGGGRTVRTVRTAMVAVGPSDEPACLSVSAAGRNGLQGRDVSNFVSAGTATVGYVGGPHAAVGASSESSARTGDLQSISVHNLVHELLPIDASHAQWITCGAYSCPPQPGMHAVGT